jgi:vacuole morphology and inheritance protein 14
MDIRISAERTSQLLLDIMEKVKNDSIEFMSLFNVVKDMLNKKDNTAE